MEWAYAENDPASLSILRDRITEVGRNFGLISYSDLVKGVQFSFPNINDGKPFQIYSHDWSGLDRRIIGDLLGYLSMESYLDAGFMASALVIGREQSKPSYSFFEWMKELNVLPDTSEETILVFWAEQVKKAHQWYKYGKST